MQKLLSTLLTIIFFQTSIFAFPVSFPFLCFPNTTTKATIGNGKIIVGGQEQTEEDLQGLNRDVNNSQTITKDQITAALDAELNVDIKLLVSLVDAIYNGDPNKLSLVKDYNKAKKSINEIKQKIQEKLTEKRRTEIEKNIKKIKFSKDKEKQKEIENKLLLDEEIQKLQAANDNKKILKEYLKKNKLSNEVTEQIEKIGATGEYSYGINGEGKLYAVKTSEADSARNNIFLSTDYLYNDITTNEKFLSIFLPGSYEEIYAGTMREASKSMAEILLETSPQLRNISDDTTQIVKDTGNLILEMAKSSGDKQTYKTALKAIKEIPNSLKETYYATTNVSNVENLQSLGYNIGDRVYDYKENPMLFVKDSARIITSYDMYEAGFNNDNMFYATGLILGGLALDIAGAPIKAGKGIVKTAKATEKIANAGKGMTKEFKYSALGVMNEAEGVRYTNWNFDKIYKLSLHNTNSNYMTLGKYMDGTMSSNSYIARAKLTGDTYFDLGTNWNEIKKSYGLTDAGMFNKFNTRALDYAVSENKVIRFTHDPRAYENSALFDEWNYLKQKHGFEDIIFKGDYWYAR